jgi:DNA replication protein DnaC
MKEPLQSDLPLDRHLDYLQLPFAKEHCRPLASDAAAKHWAHLDYFTRVIEGEAAARSDRAVARRIKAARFPVVKTLDTFRWDWPAKINRLQIQELFRLDFIEQKANAIFLGQVGLGTMPGTGLCRVGFLFFPRTGF